MLKNLPNTASRQGVDSALINLVEFFHHLPTLRTSRLVLRALRLADAGDYFAFAGDPQVTRFLRWGPHASLQETEDYLAEILTRSPRQVDGLWGIELVQEHRLVGTIHLMDIDLHDLKADVGIVVNAQYWSSGIGSEALHRVLALCFQELGLQRVQGFPITENTAARRVGEKCGMIHEGTLRSFTLQKGRWWDLDVYSILAKEFHD